MTIERATRLSRALVDKLAQRSVAMGLESAIAVGLLVPPEGFRCPPKWALAAARIVSTDWSALMRADDGPGPVQADQLGAFVGMAKTWESFLGHPTAETRELEKKAPAMTELLARVAKMSGPQFALGEKLAEVISKAPLTPRERVEFAAGQYAGSIGVVDEEGELHDEQAIRDQVCFLVWLYWADLRALESVTDLQKFLAEFEVDGLTRKNLEKICGEIGLRFKGRGRPKNPTRKGKGVGIKRSMTGVKRGDEDSRRRKKSTD